MAKTIQDPKLRQLLTDVAFMMKDIKKARELPPFADVQDQYIALGKEIEKYLEEDN